MKAEDLRGWEAEFRAFHERFADLFGRSEPREEMGKYLRGLLSAATRKNGWQMAEAVGDAKPDGIQRLLYRSEWDEETARDRLRAFVVEVFGDSDGIGVLDETGFLKKGTMSVGVSRQYSGTAGKIENCQIGVFLSYAAKESHAFLDRRLYLPRDWCDDKERGERAKVPQHVTFQTKGQLALSMLEAAWSSGVPMRWVTGDEAYGDAVFLRQAIAASGRLYVLAVSCTAPVWTERPRVEEPQGASPPAPCKGGRPRTKARLGAEMPGALHVAEVAAALPEACWHRLSVGDGEKGPRLYDWAFVRVVERHDALPGPDAWLLVRRSVKHPEEKAYYLSNAPENMPWLEMARVAATRYTVEQCFEEAKGEAGLDEYEVRQWRSWHRHVTLSMMAHAYLAWVRDLADKKGGTAQPARGVPRNSRK